MQVPIRLWRHSPVLKETPRRPACSKATGARVKGTTGAARSAEEDCSTEAAPEDVYRAIEGEQKAQATDQPIDRPTDRFASLRPPFPPRGSNSGSRVQKADDRTDGPRGLLKVRRCTGQPLASAARRALRETPNPKPGKTDTRAALGGENQVISWPGLSISNLHALRRAGLGAAGRHPRVGGESRPVGQRVFYVSSTASYAARRRVESLVLGALSSSPVHRRSCVGFGDQHRGIVVLLK